MNRIKELDINQKIIVLTLLIFFLVFTVIYSINGSKVGYLHAGGILVPNDDYSSVVYQGEIQKESASIVVTSENVVTFQWGNKQYGPYTLQEDPTAVDAEKAYLTGIEILEGDQVVFRGGFYRSGENGKNFVLLNEEGHIEISIVPVSNGTVLDSDGKEIDPLALSAAQIVELVYGPELVDQVEWYAWFCAVFISVVAIVSILFADDLFRMRLSFRVRDPDLIEPSDLELASRWFAWIILPIIALIFYIAGLK